MSAHKLPLPRWADMVVLPAVNLMIALLVAGVVVALVGQNPREVMSVLVHGAFGSQRGLSYTLYYATTFIFTGLAVSVAFHGGLFNIGGEGQALMGGLGTALVALWLSHSLPAVVLLPLMVLGGVLFGVVWAAVPAYLQAYRHSHIVITTIMFNFLASSLLAYLLVNRLKPPGTMAVESAAFGPAAKLPSMQDAMAWLGIEWPSSPLNTSLFIALVAALGVYLLLWRTRAGFRLRSVGSSEGAAAYAGINPKHQVVFAMALSGGLSGLVGMNEIAGVNGKLLLDFVAGAGFTGIAVALMGRNHPIGILLSAILFGGLIQGGFDLSLEKSNIPPETFVFIQGLIILFCGAMENLYAPAVAALLQRFKKTSAA